MAPTPAGSARGDNPAADWRQMRRIIAEDSAYSLATVPLLVDLCIKHMVTHFDSYYVVNTVYLVTYSQSGSPYALYIDPLTMEQ
jgi:hypothetical protein